MNGKVRPLQESSFTSHYVLTGRQLSYFFMLLLKSDTYQYIHFHMDLKHKCQSAYTIMNCPSFVVGVRHCLWALLLATGLILETSYFAHSQMPLVYAHEMLGQCDIFFIMKSYFFFSLHLPLLSIWSIIEPSFLTQMCIDTRSMHT